MPEQTFGGPYVQVAAICQTAIVDNMGVLSLIRLQDRIPVMGLTEQMKPQPLQSYHLVVVLKAGEMRGKATLHIALTTPSGKSQIAAESPVLFEGEERGVAIVTPLGVVVEEEGLHWLELTVEGSPLTRIPFRVMYQRIPMPPGVQMPPDDRS